MGLYFFLIINMLFSALFFKTIASKKKFSVMYVSYNMFVFTLLSMLRSVKVGNDTGTYVSLFYNIIQSADVSLYSPRFEIGYLYLNKILGLISNNHQILLIVTSLYIFWGVGRFIYKYSNMTWLSVFLFFTLGYFDLSLSGIRHMLAVTTVLIAYDFIIKKQPLRFVFTVLVASSFHIASIMFLIAYPISKFKLNKKLILLISTLGIILLMLLEKVLNIVIMYYPQYYDYLFSAKDEGEIKIATVFGLLVIMIILISGEIFNNKKNLKVEVSKLKGTSIKTNNDEIDSIFLLIACVIMVAALKVDIFNRFSQMYSIFSIVYLPNAIVKISNRYNKINVIFFVVVLFFVYVTVIQFFRPEWQSTYPFFFFWSD